MVLHGRGKASSGPIVEFSFVLGWDALPVGGNAIIRTFRRSGEASRHLFERVFRTVREDASPLQGYFVVLHCRGKASSGTDF